MVRKIFKTLARVNKKPVLQKHSLKKSYDAVVIGGGLHGLATAYFLAKNHGMNNVAVIERRYIGFGGSGRNTAIMQLLSNLMPYQLMSFGTESKRLCKSCSIWNCGIARYRFSK